MAPFYDRGRGAWYSAVAKILRGLRGLVLDAGAGTGEVACRLASQGAEVVAADSSLSMLRILWRKAVRRKVAHLVHPVASHIPLLSVREGCLDYALAIAVIHHLYGRDRRVAALRRLGRALKPGGRCFITAWYKFHPLNFLRVLSAALRGAQWGDALVAWRRGDKVLKRFYHFYSRSELRRDMLAAGLRGEVVLWDPRKKLLKRNVLAVAVRGD